MSTSWLRICLAMLAIGMGTATGAYSALGYQCTATFLGTLCVCTFLLYAGNEN